MGCEAGWRFGVGLRKRYVQVICREGGHEWRFVDGLWQNVEGLSSGVDSSVAQHTCLYWRWRQH